MFSRPSSIGLYTVTVNPDISQPSGALSNPVVQTTISRRSLSSSSHHRSLSSQHGRFLPSQLSLHVAQTVAIQAESPSQSLSIASGAQNQQEHRSSQHSIPQNSVAERVSSTVNTDYPPIPAGDQLATPAVQCPPMPLNRASNSRPRPADFVAILATDQARGDLVNDISLENMSGARKRLNDSRIGDAKTVLKFNSVFISTLVTFISPYIGRQISQQPSPPPATSIIIVDAMWLISLLLCIASTLFATSTLMLQTQFLQVPGTPRDHMPVHNRSYLFLSTLSVVLFLTGLVIFSFTVHKIVGIVVLIVFIAAGLFEMVYLVLSTYLRRPRRPLLPS